jgi:hypothetical protein
VTYHQQSEPDTEAEQNESIFNNGMFRISNQACILVKKDRPRLLERYPVLPSIGTILSSSHSNRSAGIPIM